MPNTTRKVRDKFRWLRVPAGAYADAGTRRYEGTRRASSSVCALIVKRPDGSCSWQVWGSRTADGDAPDMAAARAAVNEVWA